MATTDTNVSQLVINRLTKTQFNGATPSNTELWAVDPEFAGGKLLATDANGDIVESAIASNVTIPTVNNGTLTIQKNGTTVSTFTANSSTNVTANITVPTVNDATITITQGGVTKGSFTLNQSSGDTIALDAGGGSSLPTQTGHSGEFLTTDGTDASWAVATTVILRRL